MPVTDDVATIAMTCATLDRDPDPGNMHASTAAGVYMAGDGAVQDVQY